MMLKQIRLLLSLAGLGLLTGLAVDVYRAFRQVLGPRILKAIWDFVFWTILSFPLFWLLLWINGGEVRIYVLVSGAAGYFFYRHFTDNRVRRFILKGLRGLSAGIKRAIVLSHRFCFFGCPGGIPLKPENIIK